jgi:hypothetical protein
LVTGCNSGITGIYRNFATPKRTAIVAAQLFRKSSSQGAATQVLLAGSPHVAGIAGEYWSNCQIVAGNPLLNDRDLSSRPWNVSEPIIAARHLSDSKSIPAI